MIGAAWRLVRYVASAWVDYSAPSVGATPAFYTLFSIAPLLPVVISVAALAIWEDAARGATIGQLSGMVGVQTPSSIESLLAQPEPAERRHHRYRCGRARSAGACWEP